jgi:hypothetical protein
MTIFSFVLHCERENSGGSLPCKRRHCIEKVACFALIAASVNNIDLTLWNPSTESEKREREKPKPRMTVRLCGANYVSPEKKNRTARRLEERLEPVNEMPQESMPT